MIEVPKPPLRKTLVTGSTGFNVLSLFDGMSCGQIALQKAGIKVNQYFASEIKPHAIKVTQHNFPNTIQLGSVLDVKSSELPKIDLLIGGSPCQDFSSANKEKLGLQGEKSGLFYEYLRLLKECEPKYFLLENVAMDDYSYAAISEMLGTYPTNINSELVSGQLRQRSYWTNIGPESFDLFGNRYSMIPQPRNKKIKFQDLLDNGYTDRLKARCLLESESRNPGSTFSSLRRYMIQGFINVIFKDKETFEKYSKMTEDEMKANFIDGDIRKLNQNEKQLLTNVWYYNNKQEMTLYDHPTVKPIDMIRTIIKASSNKGDLVLDCFGGSGTTAVACLHENRQFIVMEKEQKYYDIILKRVEEFNKKFETQTLFENEM